VHSATFIKICKRESGGCGSGAATDISVLLCCRNNKL
jgi:hypothetical protein